MTCPAAVYEPGVGVMASVQVGAGVITSRLMGRVVFPWPFVVLVNVTVSLYKFAARASALELIEAVTVTEAPGANVPAVEDSPTQGCVLETV